MPTPGSGCAICGHDVVEFLDLGRQPLSDAFVLPGSHGGTPSGFSYRLGVGYCTTCSMVQLVEPVDRDLMFHQDYPYHSSGSAAMRKHFATTARTLIETEMTGSDPFLVEIGCNDGILLGEVAGAGLRHLGVDPSAGVADIARQAGASVLTAFFEEDVAASIRAEHGPADVIYGANTICHIPYLGSVLRGAAHLLSETGVFVFEDPYLGDIVEKTSFDQIYDEHFFLFSATSVGRAAEQHGLELVDVERLGVHGGEVRYTLARAGTRRPSPAVADLLTEETRRGLHDPSTLAGFAARVETIRDDLVSLLRRLARDGAEVVAYGATAKSATVTNFCGIGRDLVARVHDTTPAKQGRLTPGAGLPVVPAEEFGPPYPDFALLFAWNHADEILAKEERFRRSGGRWILYVPDVRIV